MNLGNDDSKELRAFVRLNQKRALISGLAIGYVFYVFWSRSVAFGFTAGVVISVVNFQLMAVDSFAFIGKVPLKARRFIIGRYFIRYAIIFVFFVLIVTRTDYSIFAAFMGLFFVQFILVGGRLIHAVFQNDKVSQG